MSRSKIHRNVDAAIADVLRHASTDPELVPALAVSFLDRGMTKDAAELLQLVRDHQKLTPSFLLPRRERKRPRDSNRKRAKAWIRPSALIPSPRTPWLMLPRWQSCGASGIRPLEFLDAALAAGPPRSDLLAKCCLRRIAQE